MAFPFGGVDLEALRRALVEDLGVIEMATSDPVDTLDGPKCEPFWANKSKTKIVETPKLSAGGRVSAEMLGHIIRRLGLDQSKVFSAIIKRENE